MALMNLYLPWKKRRMRLKAEAETQGALSPSLCLINDKAATESELLSLSLSFESLELLRSLVSLESRRALFDSEAECGRSSAEGRLVEASTLRSGVDTRPPVECMEEIETKASEASDAAGVMPMRPDDEVLRLPEAEEGEEERMLDAAEPEDEAEPRAESGAFFT